MNKLSLWITFITTFATIIAAIAGVWAVKIGYRGIEQQQQIYEKNKVEQTYPFFRYLYDSDARLFKVDSYDYVRINSVKWSFPKYEKDRINLITINSLSRDLSWYEIRDYFAMELLSKLSVERIFSLVKEDTECLFFAYAQEGIPAVIEVKYDLRDKQGLTSKDVILLKRLDTNFPAIQFESKAESDKELVNLLNKYKVNLIYAYEPTIEMIRKLGTTSSIKIYNGTCGILFDQPESGF